MCSDSNLFLREQFAEHWRSGYFAFGNNPSGDPFFIDLGSGSEMVLSMDHESCEVTPQPDFESWMASWPSGGAG